MDTSSTTPETQICPRCGASLQCGAASGQCWCMQRPPLGFDPGYGRCLCPDCLAALAAERALKAPENTA